MANFPNKLLPMKVRSTQLRYILKALFRDTPLAYCFQVPGGVGSLFGKHDKNCKCCPMSLFIEGWQSINVKIVVLKCQKCSSKTLWIYNYQFFLSSPHPNPILNTNSVHHILSSLDQFIQKLEILDFSLPVVSQVRVAWTQPSTLLLFPKVSSFSQVVEETEGRWKRCSGRGELGLWEETHTFWYRPKKNFLKCDSVKPTR